MLSIKHIKCLHLYIFRFGEAKNQLFFKQSYILQVFVLKTEKHGITKNKNYKP